jgi:hypothetical protein
MQEPFSAKRKMFGGNCFANFSVIRLRRTGSSAEEVHRILYNKTVVPLILWRNE